ncbi:MAG: alpha/beta hydrolase [Proteobacteria bacterium]|nr:alpha/beta hydrolase [Pseudomonadota bacterium]
MMQLINKVIQIILTVVLLSISTACSLMDTYDEAKLIESKSIISGFVKVENGDIKSVYVRLYQKKTTQLELVSQMALNSDGSYQFDVLPGSYLTAAYVDENDNQQYEKEEPGIYLGYKEHRFDFVDISQSQNKVLPNLIITGAINSVYPGELYESLNLITRNIGKVINLDDSIFEADKVSLGLWQPLSFVEEVGGGLMLLQSYDYTKTPVIFVHGVLGSPRDFKAIISNLNLDAFQPWVLYYPSGARLDMVSDYLLNALNQLHNEYGFPEVHIVSHSMGGLMSRSFLIKQQTKSSFDISLFVSINSPLYGMDSAASGVNHSPIVIPSWRDVASDSEYIKKIHNWYLPPEIPYHLIFSYLKGEDGDGVVSLSSQLSESLQDEAIKIYGFNAQHAEVLKLPELIVRLNQIMADPMMRSIEN